jgi:urease accessory protein UreF
MLTVAPGLSDRDESDEAGRRLLALADGYRAWAESWADLLRDCKRRGTHASVLTVGHGALGIWDTAARARWRLVNATRLVALVRAGAQFDTSKPVERSDEAAA